MTEAGALKKEISELNKQIEEQLEILRKQRLKLRDLRHLRDLKAELLNKLERGNT